jgi:hypothetical protein
VSEKHPTNGQRTEPNYQQCLERREEYLRLAETGEYHSPREVCEQLGVGVQNYYRWRKKYPNWAAQADSRLKGLPSPWEPGDGFAAFRQKFFGNDSPWFHLRIIDALENSGTNGEVTLILVPPEHGKTTLLEDWVGMKLALDPTFRITIGSETVTHAQKFIGRVQNRMEPDGPAKPYVHRFGPFVTPKESKRGRRQTWNMTQMHVHQKGAFDERDYSLSGLGMTGKIRGTRTDLLIIDDPQSEETLNQSAKMFGKFRHDWLSRPGAMGSTVVIMTRVGEGDFADLLMDSDILDNLIQLPAFREDYPGGGWLWPERYSEAKYDRMRRNVGEDGWDLSYMQVARPKHSIVFEKPVIESARDGMRTVLHVAERLNGQGILVGLDPGFKVTGLSAASAGPKFEILSCRKRRNLPGTEAIVAELEDLIHAVHLPEHPVTDVVIESMAFQRGLLNDPGIIQLQKVFGFRIHPHQTGTNKYDRDFGVPQMVHSLLREEITWPWADEVSRYEMRDLEDDMFRWRPNVRGTDLEQDCLMATWFPWLLWRSRQRQFNTINTEQFRSRPAPPLMFAGGKR